MLPQRNGLPTGWAHWVKQDVSLDFSSVIPLSSSRLTVRCPTYRVVGSSQI